MGWSAFFGLAGFGFRETITGKRREAPQGDFGEVM